MYYIRISAAFAILFAIIAAPELAPATPTATPTKEGNSARATTSSPPLGVKAPNKVRPDGSGNVLDGGTKPQGSAAKKSTDLRAKIARLRGRDGRTIVHQTSDHRLIAKIQNSKIVGWSATDSQGKPLPTQVVAKGVVCIVIITLPNGTQEGYEIDCDDLPAPKPSKPPAKQ